MLLFVSILIMLSGCSSDQGLTGQWNSNINGTAATMNLKQDGDDISGDVSVGNYRYTMKGSFSGQTATGKLADMNGKTLDFSLTGKENSLTLTLIARHPASGQIIRQVPLMFSRSGSGANRSASSGSAGNIDQRLVGRWRYEKIYRSGSFSTTTTRYLVMSANGTYQYGSGRLYVSAPNASGRSSRGDVQTGRWKTENSIIYINENGSGWQAYARYFVKGNSMMMTFNNGNKMLWSRY
jgi:hypothetical protein